MTLHTKDAYGLFSGRPADNPARLPPIPGGRRFAAVLKSIWHLSANDNPYADWVLIRMYDALVGIRANLARVIAAREEGMEVLKRKGLRILRDSGWLQLDMLPARDFEYADDRRKRVNPYAQ